MSRQCDSPVDGICISDSDSCLNRGSDFIFQFVFEPSVFEEATQPS